MSAATKLPMSAPTPEIRVCIHAANQRRVALILLLMLKTNREGGDSRPVKALCGEKRYAEFLEQGQELLAQLAESLDSADASLNDSTNVGAAPDPQIPSGGIAKNSLTLPTEAKVSVGPFPTGKESTL